MSNMLLGMGDNDSALASGQRALALATALRDLPLLAQANTRVGHVYHILGDYPHAMDLLRQAVETFPAEAIGERVGTANLLPMTLSVTSRTFLLWSLAEAGEFTEGVARGEEAIRVAEASEHLTNLTMACTGAGRLLLRQGNVHKAVPVLERGLSLCETGPTSTFFILTAALLGYAYALAGRVAEALPLLAQVLEDADRSGFIYSYALWVAWLSEAYLLAGRKEDALVLAHQALERSRAQKERGHQAYALRLLGEIAAQHHPQDLLQAEAHYQQALALAEALGMRPLVAHCHLGLGTLYAATRQREQACTELAAAIALYRTMDMTFWLPRAEAALAQAGGGGVAR
jgi:tetratricopeptide (TPR) repeat protein